jgi:hypothetical protein
VRKDVAEKREDVGVCERCPYSELSGDILREMRTNLKTVKVSHTFDSWTSRCI